MVKMMKDFLLKLAPVWRLKPMPLLTFFTGQKLVMPFYHAVEDEPKAHLKHTYPVKTAREFEQDLDLLLRHFKPVDIDTVRDLAQHGKQPVKRSFWLSFDDGLSSFYNIAAPVLKRKGVPATCFVNTAFIDNKDLFYRYKGSLICEHLGALKNTALQKVSDFIHVSNDPEQIKLFIQNTSYSDKAILDQIAEILEFSFKDFLANEQPYLTTNQLKSLINDGFTIGAHSIDHPKYNELELNEQLFQTTGSLKALNESFEIKRNLFSFPFSDNGVTSAFFEALKNENFMPEATFGTAGMKHDSVTTNLQRIPVENPHVNAMDVIRMEYVYYVFKSFLGKNNIRRR